MVGEGSLYKAGKLQRNKPTTLKIVTVHFIQTDKLLW